MGLFKRAFLAGLTHELTAQGIVKWASEELQNEAVDTIADSLGDEIPEQVPEEGVDPEQAEEIVNTIMAVAQELENQPENNVIDPNLNKEASAMSYEDAAAKSAMRLMVKAAEETAAATGPDVPGQSTPAEVEGPTAETQIDKARNPSSEVVVPQGKSSLDTKPGAVGKEVPTDEQPGATETPPVSEVSKLANLLGRLGVPSTKTAELSGASLSGGAVGGKTPDPRKDLDDNLNIPNVVAKAQGKTVQNVPANAMIGALTPQTKKPGPTDATHNSPAADALSKKAEELMKSEQGRAMLQKVAETYSKLAPQFQPSPEEAAAQLLGNMSNLIG